MSIAQHVSKTGSTFAIMSKVFSCKRKTIWKFYFINVRI
nr:MAG TPA: hypothetical protein [Caudoviricetes sp.]